MKQVLASLIILCGMLHAWAISPDQVIQLKGDQAFLKAQPIQGMNHIYGIRTAGPYAYALGYGETRMLLAYFNGLSWTAAQALPFMTGISAILPLYPESGYSPQALAQGLSQTAYFDGHTWQARAVDGLKNFGIYTSEGQAWAVGTHDEDWALSQFNTEAKRWEPAVSLAPWIKHVRAMAAAHGVLYLLGLNAQQQSCLVRMTHQRIYVQNLPMVQPQNMQLQAWHDQLAMVLHDADSTTFAYSLDQGQNFHFSAPAFGILLSLQGRYIWALMDKHFAYFDLKTQAWHALQPKEPVATYAVDQDHANTLCTVSQTMRFSCYEPSQARWNTLPTLKVGRVEAFKVYKGQIYGFGADLSDRPIAFYFNGQQWRLEAIADMGKSMRDMSSGQGETLWLIGH